MRIRSGLKPDQIFAGRARDRRGDDAARDRDQRREIRLVEIQAMRLRNTGCALLSDRARPRSRAVQRAGHFAGRQDLALEQQRCAAGGQRLQQRLRIVEQATRQSPSREIASIIRCSSRRTDNSACACAKLSSAAMRVAMVSASNSQAARISKGIGRGDVMMARDQAPELAADHERGDQRRTDAHVLQILDMDRRHAAQPAQRHVEIAIGDRAVPRHDRHRLVIDIDQHPNAIALIEAARDLRNVGGRIAVAEIGLEMRLAPLGEDFAVSLVVEAVDHDAVVAGQVLEQGRRSLRTAPAAKMRAMIVGSASLDHVGQVNRRDWRARVR